MSRKSWRGRLAMVGAAMAATASAAGAARSQEAGGWRGADFGQWSVSCDNTLDCTAVGGNAIYTPFVYFRVSRTGEGEAKPKITLGVADLHGKPAMLEIEDKTGAVLYRKPIHTIDDYSMVTVVPLAPEPSLIAALRDGARLRVRFPDQIPDSGVIDLSGSSASLRWMDDAQHRAGTVTALIAKGPKAASAVPAPPRPQVVIHRAPPVSQARLPKPPKFVIEATACGDHGDEPSVSRLAPGKLLWLAPCWGGSDYNVGVSLFLTDEKGRRLPAPPIEGHFGEDEQFLEGDGGTNLRYDPATRTLSASFYGNGQRATGTEAEWTWDGRAFRLSRILGGSEDHAVWDWPVTWRAEVR